MNNQLYHHGILGQKWGVRRYQNEDGTLTAAGKERYGRADTQKKNSEKTGSTTKRIATAAVLTATVATAAAVYAKNPEAVNKVISQVASTSVKSLGKAANKGKEYVVEAAKQVVAGTKEGIKEGLHDAPKRATKTVMSGAALVGAKKILDSTIGKEESAKVFQAANNKKVSSFWKTQNDNKDRDEE